MVCYLQRCLKSGWRRFFKHKGLQVLESRNGLYVLYMDRVTGESARRVRQDMPAEMICEMKSAVSLSQLVVVLLLLISSQSLPSCAHATAHLNNPTRVLGGQQIRMQQQQQEPEAAANNYDLTSRKLGIHMKIIRRPTPKVPRVKSSSSPISTQMPSLALGLSLCLFFFLLF
ncbi:hypothetical protein ACFX19_026463 [Malus domestica]